MDENIHERIKFLSRRIQELSHQQSILSAQLIQLIDEPDALKRTVNAASASILVYSFK